MKEQAQETLNKVKAAIPADAKDKLTKLVRHKYFKFAVGGLATVLLLNYLFSPVTIPPDSVMRTLIAEEVNVKDRFATIEMTSFNVDSCDVVEVAPMGDIAECTITFGTTITTKETNFMRHKPATRSKLPSSTEGFQFWLDDKGKWRMSRLF